MKSILLSDYLKGIECVKDYLKKEIKQTDKVVIIPWSFPNELDYEKFNNEWFKEGERRYNKYVDSLLSLGILKQNITILNCYDKEQFKNFKRIIDESNILFITGGNPEMLYSKVTQEAEILYDIKYYKGLIIGFSAGALLQFKRYFITAKNNYYKYFAFYDGFGVLNDPFYLDVHSSKNRRYLEKLQKVANDTKKDVYAIFDDGAIIYNRVSGTINLYGNVLKFESESNNEIISVGL